jgi:hypothetical protein
MRCFETVSGRSKADSANISGRDENRKFEHPVQAGIGLAPKPSRSAPQRGKRSIECEVHQRLRRRYLRRVSQRYT